MRFMSTKIKHYHAGYDHFTPDPGTWAECHCKACGDLMEVKRGCEGPTSWAMSMCKSKRKYDSFTCKNSGQPWHNKVIALKQEARKTSSTKIAEIINSEVQEILSSRSDIPRV
jgi:hypothetical protein